MEISKASVQSRLIAIPARVYMHERDLKKKVIEL